jgi:hypothetical protein
MAKAKKPANKSKKKPIEQYDHKGKKRVNNPPVGLVTQATDKESGRHIFDSASSPGVIFPTALFTMTVRHTERFCGTGKARRDVRVSQQRMPDPKYAKCSMFTKASCTNTGAILSST